MGIGGHILGPRKLRRLAVLTGLPLDRAYIRNHHSEGVVWTTTGCQHYRIDTDTGEYTEIPQEEIAHWTSCREHRNEGES